MATVFGKGYALVDGGDVTGLQNALSAAGSEVNSPYSIFLRAGTYSLFGTLVVFGKVRIYGAGRDTTILQQGQTNPSMMAGIFTLNDSNSILEFHNLTIKNGIANAPQFGAVDGAGIKIWAGTLIAEDCKFENNDAGNTGGAIFNGGGKVQLKRVLFTGNNAANGAAIYTSSTQNPALTAEHVRFSANGATGTGGAILASNSPGIVIANSTFLGDNTASSYAHIHNTTPAQNINAANNRWVSSPSVSTGVTTAPTLASDPTATMPVTSPEQKMVNELATYGITAYTNGNPTNGITWSLEDLRQVLIGVQYLARAFNLLKYSVASGTTSGAKALFQSVIQPIKVVRVTDAFSFGANDPCNNENNKACTSNTYATIGFIGTVNVNQYTMVHELGHRFDNRADQSVNGQPRSSITERITSGGVVVSDCDNPIQRVMGDIGGQFERGDRGWGSAAPGNFQVNALKQPGHTVAEVNEAAADMFLNWVYRRLTDNPPPADPCTAPLTGTWEGFLNWNWATNVQDGTRPGNKRYKWMHDTMVTTFSEHPWV